MDRALPNLVLRAAWPLRTLVDTVLPPRCAGCGAIVDSDARLCVTCWRSLDFLTGVGCATCNRPLTGVGDLICAPCLAMPPRHDGVRAAMQEPAYVAELAKSDQELAYLGPADYAQACRDAYANEKKVVERLGLMRQGG